MDAMRRSAVLLVGGLSLFGCAKKGGDGNGGGSATAPVAAAAPATVTAPAAQSAEFDRQWAALASKEVDAFYVEDDRGEGLMGNVRRARHEQPPAGTKNDSVATPANLSQQEIQQVIRQNLPGVKACFLRISREGEQRSGKAIVSFDVGPGGEVRDTKVDAPAFQGTSLPTCVSGMVSHWAFPKSQSGGLAVSYPFVFVGG
jgi:hypothetical protein